MQHKILPCKIQILILAAEIGKKVQIAPQRAIVHLDLTISEIVPIPGPIQDLCQLIGKQHYYALKNVLCLFMQFNTFFVKSIF